MDAEEFRKKGYKMIDYLVNYLDTISQRRVSPNVISGYLISALPKSAPKKGESYENIMEDVEKFILPGMCHWQHPGFHGYFPGCSSFPGVLARMIDDVIGYPVFEWHCSPSAGEFECLMLDWYGEMLGLPNCFLYKGYASKGAGIMFRSTSECLFVSLLTARVKFLNKLSCLNPSISKAALLCSLVAYCMIGSHSRLEKIALVTLVNIKVLGSTNKFHSLQAELLDKAIKQDKKIGLIPFFVYIKLGCNSCGQSDPVKEIGLVCKEHGVWLHVDASYAGNAAMCPEYRYLIKGIEYASSFQSSPSHWMLTPLDCSVLFVQNRFRIMDAVTEDRTRRGYSFEERDWCYPSRTESILKLFFVMRSYGVEGLQKHIRNHINLAKLFSEYIKKDDRFELMTNELGFTAFRLHGLDIFTVCLKDSINDAGKLYVTPTRIQGKYAIRFIICSKNATEDDIKFAWKEICEQAEKALNLGPRQITRRSSANELYDEFYRYALP